MSRQGGTEWFCRQLTLNGFDPIVFDGRDPAAFVWAILEMDIRLAVASGRARYPVRLPYGSRLRQREPAFQGREQASRTTYP